MAYVRIEMDDIETEDLVEELESRGYTVIDPVDKDENVETIERMEDEIYNLYLDYVQWEGNKSSCSSFESALKQFFEKHTNKIVA